MASRTAVRTARLTTAAALLVLPLTACSFGSNGVNCTTSGCTATLDSQTAEVELLGTSLAFGGVQDGRATLSVGNASVSCAQGESVTAGPLSLTCTTVTEDSVEVTASLG